MRFHHSASTALVLCIILATQSHSFSLAPYTPALPALANLDSISAPDAAHHDLLRRADNCPAGSASCAYMGYPNFCCKPTANCAIDSVGHAACCPIGAVCTGTVSGAFATAPQDTTATVSQQQTQQTTAAGAVTTTATLVPAAQATGSYSIVPNAFFPFRAIPTTYANAAGCSAAWTGCQSDMARCTAYLQGQAQQPSSAAVAVGGGGVTISAPNGGVTVNGQQQQTTTNLPQVSITMAPASAASICSSLSSAGCSGLQVTACSVFGGVSGGSGGQRCAGYGAAVLGGAAVGLAGQILLA